MGRALGRLRFTFRTSGVEPVLRLSLVLLVASLEAGLGTVTDRLRRPALRARRRTVRSRRAWERLARSLGELKGAYAKAGQFASLRHDLLPEGATRAFAGLRDRVPPLPFSSLRPLIEAELGAPLGVLFARLDPTSIGAASLAQAHRGELPDGTPVVVKVQYPWIAAALRADLAVLRFLLRLGNWWVGGRSGRAGLDRERLFDEFARSLGEELDFRHEARVAAQIAENLAGDDEIVVPRVVASHSTERILTVHHWDALPIRASEALARRGVAPGAVLRILARAYAKQVFVDGLFHADPHPGNLFVIADPRAAIPLRVLFIDFGLSKKLDDNLRRQVREGIYALLQRDTDAFLARMDALGAIAPGAEAEVGRAVTSMFERIANRGEGRPVLGQALGLAGHQVLALKDEAKSLLQETPGLQLPNDLLLYAKTLSYLFALGDELDPQVDLLKISLPYLLEFLGSRD